MLHTARIVTLAAAAGLLVSACAGMTRGATSARPFEERSAWADGREAAPRFDAGQLPATQGGVPLRGLGVEGEWRTHRGNVQRSGTRVAPSIEQPAIAWRARVGIQGYTNTPLIGGGVVYVTSQGTTHNLGDAEDGLYAFDAETGARRWFTSVDQDLNGGTLTDRFVIAGTDTGTVYAFDRDTGSIAWSTTLSTPLTHGPLVLDGTIYFAGEEGIDMLDHDSGFALGRLPGVWNGWDARGGLASDGERIFMNGRSGTLACIDGDEIAWTAAMMAPESEEWGDVVTYGPPTVAGSAVISFSLDRRYDGQTHTAMGAVDIDSGDRLWLTQTGEPLPPPVGTGTWYESYDHYYASVPWLMGGVLWAPHLGAAAVGGYALDDGEAARAVPLSDCRARQFASIVGVAGLGYLARHDGGLYGFDATTGALLWGLSLQFEADAGRQMGGNWSAFGDGMYCYSDPYDGTALFATPAIGADGTLYVGSGEGWLYAIRDASW